MRCPCSSTSAASPSPPRQVESVAAELDKRSPIRLDTGEEASCVMPCLHQFCYMCLLRGAESKPECPLWRRRRRILSIMHLVQVGDDFQEHIITPSAASSVAGHQAGVAPCHPAATTLEQQNNSLWNTSSRPPCWALG